MKRLGLLFILSLSACSYGKTVSTPMWREEPSSKPVWCEVFGKNATLKALDYQYDKANDAISVNDAEKVYLERFREDLSNK